MEDIEFHSFYRSVQKIVIYETKSRYYVVGSNDSQTKFRVLKIDRTEPRELIISDDKIVYSEREIRDLLTMIDVGNRSKVGQKMGSGFNKTISSYGMIGFVRFLEGYYIVLITKRLKVAMLGQHGVYKIEDTAMLYIPNDEVRDTHPDESRYVRMFQSIDLSSNFYFSYSYDLTNSVQYNLSPPKYVSTETKTQKIESIFSGKSSGIPKPKDVAYLSKPNSRYFWNEHLINPVRSKIHHDWLLTVIHGFVDQANISIYGSAALLTLIGRRSNKFAGTRFLKRGANKNGDVANEVETEQILADSSISSFEKASVTSFVQIRGSVPGNWSQDTTTMVPKPQIYFQSSDPMCKTAGKHFNQLMTRYGSPAIVLNLVKKRERKRKHEGLLSDYLSSSIKYLNMFLHEQNHVQYIHFDMARSRKRDDTKDNDTIVMAKLAEIAQKAVNQVGIFQSQPLPTMTNIEAKKIENHCKQTGVVRTNCVDCLDRTNTAQFVIAKVALGHQLHALGYLANPHVEYDTDCSRILEAMFEDHGDTLALQYGGSHLIHRIKCYRKESKWTSKANDITQTVRRYYSNALTDTEKQNTMNLFLGVFVPHKNKPALWDREAPQESYLHSPELCDPTLYTQSAEQAKCNLKWWDTAMRKCLPFSLAERRKECLAVLKFHHRKEPFDLYTDQYHPHVFTVVSDNFMFKEVSHSVRDYMPNCETNYSPFVVRNREGKRREEANANNVKSSFAALMSWGSGSPSSVDNEKSKSISNVPAKNPSVFGTASTASTVTVSGESDEEDLEGLSSSEESEAVTEAFEDYCDPDNETSICQGLTFEALFPDGTYGMTFDEPTEEDLEIYRRFVAWDEVAKPRGPIKGLNSIKEANVDHLFKPFDYTPHDYTKDLLPLPSEEDMKLYIRHVQIGRTGQTLPLSYQDLDLYMNYVKSTCIPTREDKENYNDCKKNMEKFRKAEDDLSKIMLQKLKMPS